MAPACRHRLAAPPLLLSDLIGHLERDAGQWDQIATEARATGGDPGRYADYAIRDRELAIWVEEAYRALGGEDRRASEAA